MEDNLKQVAIRKVKVSKNSIIKKAFLRLIFITLIVLLWYIIKGIPFYCIIAIIMIQIIILIELSNLRESDKKLFEITVIPKLTDDSLRFINNTGGVELKIKYKDIQDVHNFPTLKRLKICIKLNNGKTVIKTIYTEDIETGEEIEKIINNHINAGNKI